MTTASQSFRYLEITTVAGCPNGCSYCPQGAFKSAYRGKRILSYEDFGKVVRRLPEDVTLVFAGFSEPFLNADCVRMVELASSLGRRISIFTTLVGMSEGDVRRLAKCNISEFVLHLPDNKRNSKIRITEQYKTVLALALQTFTIDRISIMDGRFVSNGRAGLVKGAKRTHRYGFFTCRQLINPRPTMLPNGDAVLCYMDFGLRHRIGNLLADTYDEILKGPEFKRVSRNRYGIDGDVLCRSCSGADSVARFYLLKGAHILKKALIKEPSDKLRLDE
ncbi:Radical SAM superfamily protein [uncultured archaeon]|nr:Radical SAM superfamily protein [uncultured archaeon]